MAAKIVRCDRCRRRNRNNAPNWNATVRDGKVVGFLCPACQTPEEHLEAEVNLATVDYARGYRGVDGRLYAPARGGL